MSVEVTVDPKSLRLFYHPAGTLRLAVGDERCYHTVRLYQAWPLSLPGRFLSLHTAKGDEIALLDSVEVLDDDSRAVAEEELRRRYLTARVERLLSVRAEFGVSYWLVATDKGERDFVVQSLTESCVWLSDHHILLIDVDGNRFEITDRRALDPASIRLLDSVL